MNAYAWPETFGLDLRAQSLRVGEERARTPRANASGSIRSALRLSGASLSSSSSAPLTIVIVASG